jgi:release factor glutamine methyltransferase
MNRRASHLNRLRAAGVPDPAGDLRRLADWAFAGLGADEQAGWDILEDAVARRARREPVSKIKGRRAFWKHEFEVTPDVLDPRPDTETLVEQALALPFARVLDLGTGSGCILISLLAARPQARGLGTDVSDAALRVARRNAARIGVAERAGFLRADWFDGVAGAFDLIVSNPPYISAAEMAGLAAEVRDHDPRAALTDEADGLTAYRLILSHARAHLTPGGHLAVEIGATQGAAVLALFGAAGFAAPALCTDIDGRPRVIVAENPQQITQ